MNKYMEHVNSIRDSVQKQWPTDLSNGEERNGMGKTHLQQLIELDELREQLAAAQATIQQMRDFLTKIEYLEADNGCIMSAGECSNVASEALALPADRTALDALLADARKEGMLNAAVIAEDCDQEYEPYVGTPRPLNYTCADAIRQAAERSE